MKHHQAEQRAPGQDVFHVHFHVMPRHPGDEDLAARYEVVDVPARIAQAEAMRSLLISPGQEPSEPTPPPRR